MEADFGAASCRRISQGRVVNSQLGRVRLWIATSVNRRQLTGPSVPSPHDGPLDPCRFPRLAPVIGPSSTLAEGELPCRPRLELEGDSVDARTARSRSWLTCDVDLDLTLMSEGASLLVFASLMRSAKLPGRRGGVQGASEPGESDELVVADPTDRSEGVDCLLLRPNDE